MHLSLERLRLHPKRMREGGAGVSCIDWTGVGSQLRFAGPTESDHDVFVTERAVAALLEDEEYF